MKQEILCMHNIDKRFPGVHALKKANLSLYAGEIHALVGENGAGKSTLMNVLIGSVRPDQGEITIKGAAHVISSPNYAIRHGIGIVPQELNIVPDISVAENIFLGISNKKYGIISWKETYQKADALIRSLGCAIDVKSLAGSHNVAELQMVQIARALAFGAEIIIFDEPTASLTYQETRALFQIINRLKESGAGIIYISHHLEEVKELSDRVTVMRDGETVGTYATKETTESQLISLMAGQTITFNRIQRQYKSDDILLQVEHLCYKTKFTDVSFSVKRGEIYGLGGLVGAGRSEAADGQFHRCTGGDSDAAKHLDHGEADNTGGKRHAPGVRRLQRCHLRRDRGDYHTHAEKRFEARKNMIIEEKSTSSGWQLPSCRCAFLYFLT